MSRNKSITKKQIKSLLFKYPGQYSKIASELGCTRQNIESRVRKDPDLIEINNSELGSQIKEDALLALRKLVREYHPKAVELALKATAKDLGFGDGPVEDVNKEKSHTIKVEFV